MPDDAKINVSAKMLWGIFSSIIGAIAIAIFIVVQLYFSFLGKLEVAEEAKAAAEEAKPAVQVYFVPMDITERKNWPPGFMEFDMQMKTTLKSTQANKAAIEAFNKRLDRVEDKVFQ